MEATFNFSINSLNAELIKKNQAMFSNNATIELKVTDLELDETNYLLSTQENRNSLQKSINQ